MTTAVNKDSHLASFIFMGALRSAAGFPIEHPLELMKITAQAYPKSSSREVIQTIIKDKGLLGFSNTMLTNFPRRVLREAVRWPVIGYTHELLVMKFPRKFSREGTSSKLVTAVSVAIFDSLVVLPLEQLMAYRVKEGAPYRSFFNRQFTLDGVLSLYNGVVVNLFRQGVTWISIMAINNEVKKKFDYFDKDRAHPYIRQGVASICIATGLITWALPIDFVKTRIQMDPDLQKTKIISVVRTLLLRHQLSGFYAGALPVFIHTIFHATLGGYILDKIFSQGK